MYGSFWTNTSENVLYTHRNHRKLKWSFPFVTIDQIMFFDGDSASVTGAAASSQRVQELELRVSEAQAAFCLQLELLSPKPQACKHPKGD